MGQFSWLDSLDQKTAIRLGDTAYILIPEQFADEIRAYIPYSDFDGKRIKTDGYDCYGHFGSADAYDVVAITNRHCVKKLTKSNFVSKEKADDWASGMSAKEYEKKYGEETLRNLGIDLYFSDLCDFPLKITHDSNAVYEDPRCLPSPNDPDQGC